MQKQKQHAFANISPCRVYLKTEREKERKRKGERRSPNSAKDDFNAAGGVRKGSIAPNYGNAQRPVPACSAVYLFADGPGEPPYILHVDSWPGRPWGSSSARPAPDTGNQCMYAHRISFPTAYKMISRDMREEWFKEIIFFSNKKSRWHGWRYEQIAV